MQNTSNSFCIYFSICIPLHQQSMLDEVKVRAKKSAKYGKTYEYQFEVVPIGGDRNRLGKGESLTTSSHGAKNCPMATIPAYPAMSIPGTARTLPTICISVHSIIQKHPGNPEISGVYVIYSPWAVAPSLIAL